MSADTPKSADDFALTEISEVDLEKASGGKVRFDDIPVTKKTDKSS